MTATPPAGGESGVRLVIRVSKRQADAFASRPDILSRAGFLAKFERDSHSEDPVCDYLGDRQQMVLGAPRGTETILLQGTIERVKEVRHFRCFLDFRLLRKHILCDPRLLLGGFVVVTISGYYYLHR